MVMITILTALLIGLIASLVVFLKARFKSEKTPVLEHKSDKNSRSDKNKAKCLVFFGSQTGTSEEYSFRLCNDIKQLDLECHVLDLGLYETAEFLITISPETLVIFIVSTYGNGEPVDTCKAFYASLLGSQALTLTHLRFALFGLGNRLYENFNSAATSLDQALTRLGAERLGPMGLGDDNLNMEQDFLVWKENLLEELGTLFDIDPNVLLGSSQGPPIRNFTCQELSVLSSDALVYTGEIGLCRKKALVKTKKFYDVKNPYDAKISSYKALNFDPERPYLYIEFDLGTSHIHYQIGDHVSLFPKNNPWLVQRLLKALNIVNSDVIIQMSPTDRLYSVKKTPFPCPCSYQTAFTYYVDISSPVKTYILKALSYYTMDNSSTRDFLFKMSRVCGKTAYQDYILAPSRNILNVLEEHPCIQIPPDYLLELLPRLHCRYYSISTSPRLDPNKLAIVLKCVKYQTSLGSNVIGVTSDWMTTLTSSFSSQDSNNYDQSSEKNSIKFNSKLANKFEPVPLFVTRTTFKLPRSQELPIILIAAGSGLAPFIGFLDERAFHQNRGIKLGPASLYFGCRHPQQDYIFQDKLETCQKDGILTHLLISFSRPDLPQQKTHVHHSMLQDSHYLYNLVTNQNAHIYVCGNAKTMARDVYNVWIKIIALHCPGKKNEAEDFIKNLKATKRYFEDVWN